MRPDEVAAERGGTAEKAGAQAVARWLSGRARGAVVAYLDGEPGAVWAVNGEVRVAFGFTIGEDARVVRVDLIGDPAVLAALDIEVAG